ncbi:hypothetical protein HUN08_14800 [Gordonia sp. X0973]|uniref:hypothetical protein n=1 Tax=Gordonia sp. X0973 TaxID=2742602 RepID=UPI000F536544|nr:hypothetical protein [Gordonia sp. X0973]QKT08325.1 hypothetical protein HUN08_14800 [Gordonia sp. X0973]
MRSKAMIAALVASAAVTTGSLAVGAGAASAQIASGHYTYTMYYPDGATVISYPVIVRGDRIYLSGQRSWHDIVPTKRGGAYTLEDLTRYNFWRSGNGYVGKAYIWRIPPSPSVTSRVTLTPR